GRAVVGGDPGKRVWGDEQGGERGDFQARGGVGVGGPPLAASRRSRKRHGIFTSSTATPRQRIPPRPPSPVPATSSGTSRQSPRSPAASVPAGHCSGSRTPDM